MKRFLVLVIAFLGCGGGGGGGGGPQFAGIWRGTLIVTSNTCDFIRPPNDVVMTVNQDGNRIVIETGTGRTYEGFVTGDNSFSATRQEQSQCVFDNGEPAPGSFIISVRTFEFSNVQGNKAHVRFIDQFGNCSGDNRNDDTCEEVSEAEATRD